MQVLVAPVDAAARARYEAYKRGEYIPPPPVEPAEVSEKQWDTFASILAMEYKRREESCITQKSCTKER